MREIEVRVNGISATFALLDDTAPTTAAALWDSLPCAGTATHARRAGCAVWTTVQAQPLAGTTRNELPVTSIYPGTLVVRPSRDGRAEILIAYGPAESRSAVGRTYVTPVAEVSGDEPAFFAQLERLWREGPATIEVSRVQP